MQYFFRVFLFCLAAFSALTNAAEVPAATVKRVMMDTQYGTKVFIQLDTDQSERALCHTSGGWHFVMDVADPIGKEFYSMLLTLYASGKTGRFVGIDSCELFSNIETLGRIELK